MFNKLSIFCILFVAFLSASFAEEPSYKEISNVFKKGTLEEKMEITDDIIQRTITNAKLEKILIRELKKSKSAKADTKYLEAIATISQKPQDAYKRFFKKAEKLHNEEENGQRIHERTYMFEITNMENVPDSLILYLLDDKNRHKITLMRRRNLLMDFMNKDGSVIQTVVDNIDVNTSLIFSALSRLDKIAEMDLSPFKKYRDEYPEDFLAIYGKYSGYSDEALNFALEHSDLPEGDWFPLVYDTILSRSLLILAKHALYSEAAMNKIMEHVEYDSFYYAIYALKKYPEVMKELEPKITDKVISMLEDSSQNYLNVRIEQLTYLSNLSIADDRIEKVILENVEITENYIERIESIYALKSIEKLSEETVSYLEGLIDNDQSDVLRNFENIFKGKSGTDAEAQEKLYDVGPYYAAMVLLKNNPEHVAATEIIKNYYNANFPFLGVDHEQDFYDLLGFNDHFGSFLRTQYFYSMYLSISPIEAFGYKFKPESEEFMSLIELGLRSPILVRNINASRMIIDHKLPISGNVQKLILNKAKNNVVGPSFNYFIRALEFAEANEETIKALKEIAQEDQSNRRFYANKVLQSYSL